MSLGDVFFGYEGRISRPLFMVCALVLLAASEAIRLLLVGLAPLVLSPGALVMATILGSVCLFGGSLASATALIVKRLHDLQRPGMLAVGFFVLPSVVASIIHTLPVLGLPVGTLVGVKFAALAVMAWGLLDLLAEDGTSGENAFGPDPLAA